MQETAKENNLHEEAVSEETYSLSIHFVREVTRALEEGETGSIRSLILALHAADLAELIKLLSSDLREKLIAVIGPDFDPEVLTHLDQDVKDDIIDHLGAEKSAEAIAQLDTDDAVQVMSDLTAQEQKEILEEVPAQVRDDLMEGLSYPESSAGRLMQKKFVSVPEFWTVGDTIDFMRGDADLPDDFYAIFVVDPGFKPLGELLLSRVMQNKREMKVQDIMNDDLRLIPIDMDQEEVANIFRKYGLVEAPVVNEEGRLVGAITVDDVVDVIQEESEENLMRLGGVSRQNFHASIMQIVPHRFWWLFVNFITAVLASYVISRFQNSIQHLVALAVLMPIIASMGGNAGIQTVTVAVRALTTRDLQATNAPSVTVKEVIIGLLNGIGMALVSGLGVVFFFHDIKLALVFGVAMVLNMVVAGFWGVTIPLFFEKFRIDPAITSGVFLTMMTDVTGFFTFLGLATLFLM